MIHSTTEHALLNDALDRITALERSSAASTAKLERALKRLRARIAAQEKRPSRVYVKYRTK